MESIPAMNFYDIEESFDNIVILKINKEDNFYKQISIEEFFNLLENYETKLQENSNIIKYNSLTINTDSTEVYKNEVKINLSPKEYKLLLLFIDNKGKVLFKEQIINCVWGVAYADAGMLRVAIKRLRNKIDPKTRHLKTIRGKGYMLVDN